MIQLQWCESAELNFNMANEKKKKTNRLNKVFFRTGDFDYMCIKPIKHKPVEFLLHFFQPVPGSWLFLICLSTQTANVKGAKIH